MGVEIMIRTYTTTARKRKGLKPLSKEKGMQVPGKMGLWSTTVSKPRGREEGSYTVTGAGGRDETVALSPNLFTPSTKAIPSAVRDEEATYYGKTQLGYRAAQQVEKQGPLLNVGTLDTSEAPTLRSEVTPPGGLKPTPKPKPKPGGPGEPGPSYSLLPGIEDPRVRRMTLLGGQRYKRWLKRRGG